MERGLKITVAILFENEFNSLIQEGALGFYNRCEINEIVLFNRKTKKGYNYYTLAVFEEAPIPSQKVINLTQSLIPITND